MHSSFISCQAVRKPSYLPRKWRSKAARSRPACSTIVSIDVSMYPLGADFDQRLDQTLPLGRGSGPGLGLEH